MLLKQRHCTNRQSKNKWKIMQFIQENHIIQINTEPLTKFEKQT